MEKELNSFKRFLGKLKWKDDKGVGVAVITIAIFLSTVLFVPGEQTLTLTNVTIILILATVLTLNSQAKEYREKLPEYKLEEEKKLLKRTIEQAKSLKGKINNKKAQSLLESYSPLFGSIEQEDSIERIQNKKEELKELIIIVQKIRAMESEIKIIEREYEELPQKRKQLKELEKELENK